MNPRHIILRRIEPASAGAAPAGPRAGASGAAGPSGAAAAKRPSRLRDGAARGLSAFRIEAASLSPGEVLDVQRERDVLAVAPPMPMALVAPVARRRLRARAGAPVAAVAWGVEAVGAHRSPFTGEGVTVAVIDTGIDAAHTAFKGVTLLRRNFTQEAEDDRHGHGTHCAGTIFGRPVEGLRIGVAPGVKRALIAKVLGRGGGSSEQIVDAVQWAVAEGAQVVSMSLGIDFPGYVAALQRQGLPVAEATSKALEGYRANIALFEALAQLLAARAQPVMLVAAAGNESQRSGRPAYTIAVAPPAAASGVVSVAALGAAAPAAADAPWTVADFSNTGAACAGPGVAIRSAAPGGGLAEMSGTSMATPHVAGVAALWHQQMAARGPVSLAAWQARLVGSGQPAGLAVADVGTGLVQAPQATLGPAGTPGGPVKPKPRRGRGGVGG